MNDKEEKRWLREQIRLQRELIGVLEESLRESETTIQHLIESLRVAKNEA